VSLVVQVCAGLYNRDDNHFGGQEVYTLGSTNNLLDGLWLAELEGFVPETTSADAFVTECLQNMAEGYFLYDYEEQKALIPNVITMAAVTSAVPIATSMVGSLRLPPSLEQRFDLARRWKFHTPLMATSEMYNRYINETTGLAKVNPGYDHNQGVKGKFDPPLTGNSDMHLVDFIVKERLFALYMNLNCVPGTRQHDLMNEIVTNNQWARPIPVYGYDDTVPLFGGNTFEAETNCVSSHNLGQIASLGFNNLGYFSRERHKITSPLSQPPDPDVDIQYDSSTTYVAFIIGDGDNLLYMKSRNYLWTSARLVRCRNDPTSSKLCFPLTWTISPQAVKVMPQIVLYFYNFAAQTGRDFFTLPPSGDLYSYPSMFSEANQMSYVDDVLDDFQLMDLTTSVHWEWFFSWRQAINDYFPKFSSRISNPIGFFLTNVPFDIPLLLFGKDEDFKIVGEQSNVVLFKPNEWRGVNGATRQAPSPDDMARRINEAEKGTILHIYLTSDGGASIDSLYSLADRLEDHVKIVSGDALVKLAVQKEGVEEDVN